MNFSFQSLLDQVKILFCSFSTFYRVSDVDECEVTSGLCGHGGICQNTIGSYTCTQIPGVDCPPGFAFDLNLQSCLGLFTFLLVVLSLFYCMPCCRCRFGWVFQYCSCFHIYVSFVILYYAVYGTIIYPPCIWFIYGIQNLQALIFFCIYNNHVRDKVLFWFTVNKKKKLSFNLEQVK